MNLPSSSTLRTPQANKLDEADLRWEPRHLRTPNGERLFGGGVEYGTWYSDAHSRTPAGGKPASIVLGWDGGTDGQQYSKTSSTPLILQVGNTSSSSTQNTMVLTYIKMPRCPNEATRTMTKNRMPVWRLVCMDVLQQTIALVRDALALAVTHGFKAIIHGVKRHLYPKLCSVVLDHPELQKFALASNGRFSTVRRLRNGRSIDRAARPQLESDVLSLLHEIRRLHGLGLKKEAKQVVVTLARRHRMYPLPHCLSSDSDRIGRCPEGLILPTPEGMFSVMKPDSFHFKHNLAKYCLTEIDSALKCVI